VRIKDQVRSGDTLLNQVNAFADHVVSVHDEATTKCRRRISASTAMRTPPRRRRPEPGDPDRRREHILRAGPRYDPHRHPARDLEYVQSTGVYSSTPNTVVWDLGDVASDRPMQTFRLTVRPAAGMMPNDSATIRFTLRSYGMSPISTDETIYVDDPRPPT